MANTRSVYHNRYRPLAMLMAVVMVIGAVLLVGGGKAEASGGVTVTPIDQVDVVNETTGLPTRLGDEVTIEGLATVGTEVISTRNTIIFVQDGTGGIGLFAPKIAVEVRQGDRVRITGEVENSRGEFIPVTAEIARCGEVEGILAPHVRLVQEILGEVLGEAAVVLDGENVRRQETNLGNLIADAIREYVQAEIAIQNGGGIRASIDEGPITFGEIYTTLPFENYIVALNLTGEKLLAALEINVTG